MKNPYKTYVKKIAAHLKAADVLPLGGFPPGKKIKIAAAAPKVLLFSPHPDDECCTGLLPLRLMREAGMRIINVPVTFGSNVERQAARAEELKNACGFLGWEIYHRPDGFQSLEKSDVVKILKAAQPAAIFFPHSKDWNSRHVATHFLVMEALAEMEKSFSCAVIETEVWGGLDEPNLLVEADVDLLADLIAALSFHVGEVQRTPYHLMLPSWMQDGVRRGSERVGGQGAAAPDFMFATLYRMRRWENGKLCECLDKGRMAALSDHLKELF
jgi:LmbE family N-acetylglucosaminyl deacetylase